MKNKKIIFAIILFLFIGLTVFTFAQAPENEVLDEGSGSGSEVEQGGSAPTNNDDQANDDQEDKDEPTQEVVESETAGNNYIAGNTGTSGNTTGNNGTTGNSGNNGSSNNQGNSNQNEEDNGNGNQEQDNSYDEALKAVEQAEASHSQADVDHAKQLVDALTDKKDLQNRLDAVQAIIDAETIIARLENNLGDAANRTDVLAVKTDRDESDVQDLLSQITDEKMLNDLTERLNNVSKVVEDDEAPQISGVNGEFTKEDVIVTATDAAGNALVATINGQTYTLGTEITADGTYTVIVRDAAYNEAKVTFTIDKTAPVITIAEEGIEIDGVMNYGESVTPVITEANIDSITLTKNGETVTYNQNDAISEDGTYVLTVTDKTGHSVSLTFVIDKTAPVGSDLGILNVTHYREENTNLGYAKIDDEIRIIVHFKEKLATMPTLVLNGTELADKFFYAEQSSNEANNDYVYMADVKLTQEIMDQVSLQDGNIDFTIKGYADALGNVGADLTNADIAENATYPNVEFDTIAPVAANFSNGNTFSSLEVVIEDKNFDYMYIYDSYNGNTLVEREDDTSNTWLMNSGDTQYRIEAFDKAGNQLTIWIYQDSTHPSVVGIGYNGGQEVEFTNGGSYQSVNLTIQDNDLISAILKDEDGNETTLCSYTWEDEERPCSVSDLEDGKYTLTVTDRAKNQTIVTFAIDNKPANRNYSTLAFDGTDKVSYDVDNQKAYYMKNGDSVVFRIAFDEELKEVPTVTIGGQNVEMTSKGLAQTNDGQDIYVYEGAFTIAEDESLMEEGKLAVVLSNVVDKAGNVSKDEIVLNQTPTSNNRVMIYDRTIPEITSITQEYESKEDRRIKVTIVTSEEVSGSEFHDYAWRKVSENTYINYFYSTQDVKVAFADKAGNPGSYSFTVDKTAPIVTASVSNNGEPTNKAVVVTLTSNEALQEIEGWTKVSDTVFTKEYTENNTFSVDVKDIVGNPTTVEFEVKGYDAIAPKYETLRLLRIYPEYGTNAKTGDIIRIIVNFDDVTLAVKPTIRLGNDKNYIVKTMNWDSNMQSYTLDYIINDTELPEGELEIQIYGYADIAGNVGEILTNDNINHETQNKVVIDRGNPNFDLSQIPSLFKVGYDKYVYPQPGVVTDEIDGNISFSQVHMQWYKKTDDGQKGEVTTCFGGDNWNTGLTNCELGTYIISYTVYDKAGNKAYTEQEITLVKDEPATITPDRADVTDFIQGEDIYAGETGVAYDDYDNIDFSDVNIDYYLQNGDSETAYEFQLNSTLSDLPAGIYHIRYWYTDSVGNNTTINKVFNLKNLQAIQAVSDLVDEAVRAMNNGNLSKAEQQHAIDYALQEANKLPDFGEKVTLLSKIDSLQATMNNNKKYDEITKYYETAKTSVGANDFETAQHNIDIVKQQLPNLTGYETEKANILDGVNKLQDAINNRKKYDSILGYYELAKTSVGANDFETAQHNIDIVKQQLPNLTGYETEKTNILDGVNKLQDAINNRKKYDSILGYYELAKTSVEAGDYETAQHNIDIVKQQLPNLTGYETEKANILKRVEALESQMK